MIVSLDGVRVLLQPLRPLLNSQLLGQCLFKSRRQVDAKRSGLFKQVAEDLDFNGGHDFKPSNFYGLEAEIQKYIQNKYETEVWVNKPTEEKQGNTSSWKISIAKEANRPDLPRQQMHIDVCAIPSFDVEKRALLNHYNIVVPTEGLLIPVQSLQETLADKLIALAYRARRIKPRDVWDIVWIKQRGIDLSPVLVDKKLEARGKDKKDFVESLHTQIDS